jgi:hypothetical protein
MAPLMHQSLPLVQHHLTRAAVARDRLQLEELVDVGMAAIGVDLGTQHECLQARGRMARCSKDDHQDPL